ncbi:hypothetical protein [Chitinophaga sp. LS1]|uniref:hypothetical protein n=1 Tax=Chitinophaga sp. LS1 TaxID=3051176 RepID=UPI002AAA85D8|nr:hypothetical protein [Chitinophaga sp. LS1]WPV65396.1 hypothetical protein QQL36_26705 [Chitinophaga sp. LS1]
MFLKTVNISQFINRVHWAYGEGGGTAADYFASTINNAANKFGEDQMYAGMTTKMKADKVPITSENQKKIYFYQTMPAGKEKVNDNYTGFNTLVGGEDLTSLPNINADKKDDLKLQIRKTRIREGIVAAKKVLTGETTDLVAGATKWGSGSGSQAEKANRDQSTQGTVITKVNQNTGFINTTTWFYLPKPWTQRTGNTTGKINEVNLDKQKIH